MSNNNKSFLRITTLIIIFPLSVLLLYGVLSHAFFFFSLKKELHQELINYEQTLMDSQKNNLKEKVNNLVQYIKYYDEQSSDKIKKDIKDIVSVTANIANNLYKTYHNKLSEEEMKTLIKNALRPIKFEGDIGYLFLLDLKGNAIVHADKKMEGTNVLNIQDINGKYILHEFNKVLKESGEGFVDYYWYIVGENKKNMHYKISFVKMLDYYDWYIGAGEYLNLMSKFVQKDILKYIQDNSTFNHGYFFITNSKGQFIFKPKNRQVNTLDTYQKEGFSTNAKYLSYTKYIPKYNWYLTANKDLADIYENINKKKLNSETKETSNIKTNLLILMITWVISLLLSLYLSMIINKMLKNYEERLQSINNKLVFQSRQALIGELFSMIAHQWRQPINKVASILALIQFKLSKKQLDIDFINKKCDEIEDSIEFMSETIDDFRTFYQPKAESEIINLKELILKSINFIDSAIQKKEIKVIKELENIELKLYGNEFLQVIINLIKNAVDAMSKGGTIIVKLQKRGNQIVISIEDNGVGIDKELIPKVFDPYFTTKKDSMGLGLYMSKMIVERHLNGTIKIERLEKGTKFSIYLKAIREESYSPFLTTPPPKGGGFFRTPN